MADPAFISPQDLKKRRQDLKRRRVIHYWQGLWRSLALTGLAAGAFWMITRPNWILYDSQQILVEGNQALSANTIRSLVPLSYPQSLLSLRPQQLAIAIEAKGPIAEATVVRHIIPPSLTVHVRERFPVARSMTPISPQSPSNAATMGYLDAEGHWLPENSYMQVTKEITFPTLEVRGIRQSQLPQWAKIYPLLSRSVVKIEAIDWQDAGNLTLQTEIGAVRLGGDLTKLSDQLQALAKLRHLANYLPSQNMQYIDLSNSAKPYVKLNQPVTPPETLPKP